MLLPKDYVRLRMTGEYASDMSDARHILARCREARQWSDVLLAASDMSRDQMPKLYEGTDATGKLTHGGGQGLGHADAVVAGGGGDNAASALRHRRRERGAAFVSLGTSGVLFVSNARFMPNVGERPPRLLPCVPNTWHQMGVILSATASL